MELGFRYCKRELGSIAECQDFVFYAVIVAMARLVVWSAFFCLRHSLPPLAPDLSNKACLECFDSMTAGNIACEISTTEQFHDSN